MNSNFPNMHPELIYRISRSRERYPVDTIEWDRVRESYRAIQGYISNTPAGEGNLYGVDTCFGPHAYVGLDDRGSIQLSLINHLSVAKPSGLEYLTEEESRAVLSARIAVLGRGASGIREELIRKLIELLETNDIPRIPLRGSLGASGDLIPLSAIAKHLLDGGWDFQPKEAIAITNGTSFMTGLLSYQHSSAKRLTDLLMKAIKIQVGILPVFPSAFHPDLNEWKNSSGAVWVSEYLYTKLKPRNKESGSRVQDSYVIRAIPQIWGSFLDQMSYLEKGISMELISVSDNPVYSFKEKRFLEGGLFYGSQISLLADQWNLAVVHLATWLERMIQYLLDPSENENRLPLLLSKTPGRNAGLAGLGLLATHLVGEMRRDSHPGSVQSLPGNAGNQNIVPMGSLSVVRNRRTLKDFQSLIEVYIMVLRQAWYLLGEEKLEVLDEEEKFRQLFSRIPPVEEDRPLGVELEKIEAFIQDWL